MAVLVRRVREVTTTVNLESERIKQDTQAQCSVHILGVPKEKVELVDLLISDSMCLDIYQPIDWKYLSDPQIMVGYFDNVDDFYEWPAQISKISIDENISYKVRWFRPERERRIELCGVQNEELVTLFFEDLCGRISSSTYDSEKFKLELTFYKVPETIVSGKTYTIEGHADIVAQKLFEPPSVQTLTLQKNPFSVELVGQPPSIKADVVVRAIESSGERNVDARRVAGLHRRSERKRAAPRAASGDIAAAPRSQLQAKAVAYLCCPSSANCSRQDPPNTAIRSLVYQCLDKARELGASSIAFPAEGFTKLGYHEMNVANQVYDALNEFGQVQQSGLRHVTIYASSGYVYKAFIQQRHRLQGDIQLAQQVMDGHENRGTRERVHGHIEMRDNQSLLANYMYAAERPGPNILEKKIRLDSMDLSFVHGYSDDQATEVVVERLNTCTPSNALTEKCEVVGFKDGHLCRNLILTVDASMPSAAAARKCLEYASKRGASSITFRDLCKGEVSEMEEVSDVVYAVAKGTSGITFKLLRFCMSEPTIMDDFLEIMASKLSQLLSPSLEPDEEGDEDQENWEWRIPLLIIIHNATVESLSDSPKDLPFCETIIKPRSTIKRLTDFQKVFISRRCLEHCTSASVFTDHICLSSMNKLELDRMVEFVKRFLLKAKSFRRKEESIWKSVKWQFRYAGQEWCNYPPALNALIELSFLKNIPALKYGFPGNRYIINYSKYADCGEDEPTDLVEIRRCEDCSDTCYPPVWHPGPSYDEISLERNLSEYQWVCTEFHRSFGIHRPTVLGIKRIQNRRLWVQYVQQKKKTTACMTRGSGQPVERHLWHGTRVDVTSQICQHGFDRSHCGFNATRYGQGVYFARDASYSAMPAYSVPNEEGHRHVIYARVLTGEYESGNSAMRTPSFKPDHPTLRFESTVDDIQNPCIFVTYHDSQAYPEYVIKFTY